MCGRHWKEVMLISGRELDLAPETFKLQHLLNAKLLAHKEEVRTYVSFVVPNRGFVHTHVSGK